MTKIEIFSIRQMVELTGLSEFTIRGWENRYSAFTPKRSETGRREYSKSDIERALLLRELLKRGHKIGAVAKLNNQKLGALFERFQESAQAPGTDPRLSAISEVLELMALQKWTELEARIRSIRSKSVADMVHKFFLPVLQAVSANIDAGLVSVSQEHIFSSILKEKIYSALGEHNKKSRFTGKTARFVLASPEGDYHETGLLLAHLLIRSHGWTSLYLGPHTPAQDLSETALRFDASHLLIVSTVSKKGGAKQELLSYISEVQRKVGLNLRVLVAGRQAPLAQSTHSPISILADFHTLDSFLRDLEETYG